jgi:hypothetical protein
MKASVQTSKMLWLNVFPRAFKTRFISTSPRIFSQKLWYLSPLHCDRTFQNLAIGATFVASAAPTYSKRDIYRLVEYIKRLLVHFTSTKR